jgi:hypothetical protein
MLYACEGDWTTVAVDTVTRDWDLEGSSGSWCRVWLPAWCVVMQSLPGSALPTRDGML